VTIGVERSGLVALRAIRAEAQGICSRNPASLNFLLTQKPESYPDIGHKNSGIQVNI